MPSLLQGVRGRKPVDLARLEQLLVQFSLLVVEQPWIEEIDINPLLASPERLIALDARVVLHDSNISEDKLPKPAIRPYPTQYVEPLTNYERSPASLLPHVFTAKLHISTVFTQPGLYVICFTLN